MADSLPEDFGFSKTQQTKKNGKLRNKHNRDKQYTEYLHTFPCAICGKYPIETHHIDGRKFGTNDHRQVPLCLNHHRGMDGVHTIGKHTFEAKFLVNLSKMADEYYQEYLKDCQDMCK